MASKRPTARRRLSAWLPIALAIALVIAAAAWLVPKPTTRVTTVDGEYTWNRDEAPAARDFIWEPATPLEIAQKKQPRKIERKDDAASREARPTAIRPTLADGGNTLYFTLRLQGRSANFYRSRRVDGRWQPPELLEELSTRFDEIGLVFSADGREAYFSSNRPGGHGGYDLYVARREGQTWGEPANLGAGINSAADEFDPAISAAGTLLIFASNAAGSEGESGQLSLYITRRDAPGRPWSSCTAMTGINPTGTNTKSPALSPDGAYLYFASDRPQWSGEPRNFDLYRVRLNRGAQPGEVENLGLSINSPANETEPAISPEGFTLLFSSDRENKDANLDGGLGLYRSRAKEVVTTTSWDTTNWQAFSAVWIPAVSLLVLLLALIVLFNYFSRHIARGASSARFFLASLFVHLLLVLLAGFATLGKAVLDRRAEIIEVQGADVVEDSLHQSHEAGQEAYEKTGDLPSIDKVVTPELTRQITRAPTVAVGSQRPEVTISAAKARQLPPERVIRVQPEPVAEKTPRAELERRPVTLPRDAIDDVVPVELVAQEAMPKQPSLKRDVNVSRQPAVNNPRVAAAELPRRSLTPTAEPIEARAAEVNVPTIPRRPTQDLPQRPREQLAPSDAESIDPPVRVAASDQRTESKVAANVSVGRQPRAPAQPAAPEVGTSRPPTVARIVRSPGTRADDVVPRPVAEPGEPKIPRAVTKIAKSMPGLLFESAKVEAVPAEKLDAKKPAEATVARGSQSIPTPAAAPPSGVARTVTLPRSTRLPKGLTPGPSPAAPGRPDTTKVARAASLQRQPAVTENAAASAPLEKRELAKEKQPDGSVELARQSPALVAPVGTPRESGGPLDPRRRPVAVGSLAEKTVDAPPAFHPHISRLLRRPAKATPVAYAVDSVGTREMFMLREGAARKEFLEVFGGNQKSEQAIRLGLAWLVKHQHEDGHWGLHDFNKCCKGHPKCSGHGGNNSDTAATGLALLPFLGTGQTHKSGEHRQAIDRGLAWLLKHQKPDGDLFTGGTGNAHMYSHGIAAIALCEAYGMTREPRLREPAQKALNFIVAAQHKGTGGWRYRPGQPGDTSVVGWQVMALKSGEIGGLTVPKATLHLAGKWLDSAEGTGKQIGQFGYQGQSGIKPAMTAEGLLCRQLLGTRRGAPSLRAGADFLLTRLPTRGQDTSYYWYYATQVMFHMQGDDWQRWNAAMRDLLIETQVKTGHMAGTWNPTDGWERQGGRIYSTSLRLLMLQVYYRHLPLFRQLDE